jgi:peptidoglycan hydrolase-like protein with peptidoglycan-binding domain
VTSTATVKSLACYADSTSGPTSSDTYTLTCTTTVLTNGTVGAYPTCALSCSSGYTLSGSSCNANAVANTSSGGGGGGASDTTAPTITNVIAAPTTGNTATITWKTNESSLSWVLYGTTTAYGQQVKTTTYPTSHSVILTGLTPTTTYHYLVKSQDPSGNVGVSTDKIFTTLAAGASAIAPTTTTTTTTTETTPTVQKPISQMTRAELIAFILQLIAGMNAGGTAGTGSSGSGSSVSGIPSTFTFQNNLAFGMTSIDVKYLQIVLNSNADTRIALTGAGSPGNETTKFGPATLVAVKKFQVKYGIANFGNAGYGLVGPATRAKLNSLLGK